MTGTLNPATGSEAVRIAALANLALGAAGQGDLIWGHVSVRDPGGRGVWMKSAGWGFDESDIDNVVLVDERGEVLQGRGMRHLEYPIHTEIMTARADVHCVVHSHAMIVNAFSSLGSDLVPLSHDGVLFVDPPLPRFELTSNLITSQGLGRALADCLGQAHACLIPQHGLVAVGEDAPSAVMHAVFLEKACRVQLLAMSSGRITRSTPSEEVAAKKRDVWKHDQLTAGWRYLVRQGLAERARRKSQTSNWSSWETALAFGPLATDPSVEDGYGDTGWPTHRLVEEDGKQW